MKRSNKHKSIAPLDLKITDGIDLRVSAIAIPDTASPLLQNWYYQKGAKDPSIRPAVTCETGTALGAAIVFLFPYSKDASTTYIMGVSSAFDVYYFNSATSLWVDTTINVAQKPVAITFNGKLLLADGSTTLKTWDGTTAGTQSIDGTISPSCIEEIDNRVVVNDSSATGLDLVCFSAVEDETAWTFTEAGGAVALRAGYKDGLKVVALVKNFKNELIVFKQGEKTESTYRVQTLGAPYASTVSQWVAEFVMGNNGASNGFCVESVDTGILFLGRYGFSALVADQLYSELNLTSIGDKVNHVLGAVGNTNLEIKYLATSGQVWILRQATTIYIYHPHNGAFTTYNLNNEQINSVIETTDGIFFAGASGHLYGLSESIYQDEFTPSTKTDIPGVLKTKEIDMGEGGGLVKFTEVLFNPILQCATKIYYLDESKNIDTLVDTGSGSGTFLQDFMLATLDFMASSAYDFMGTDGLPWSQEIRNKWKCKRFQIRINTTGRCGLASITGQIALLGA